jgi:hypothetical protein
LRRAVRNPFDAVTSWWNLEYTPLVKGHVDHEGKVQVRQFTMGDRPRLLEYAKRWRNHAAYWQQAPLRTHTIRYDRVLRDQVGDLPELRGFCDKVGFDNSRDGFRVVDAPSVPYRPNRPTRAACVLSSALLEGQVTDVRSCRTPISPACALSVWVSYTLPLRRVIKEL